MHGRAAAFLRRAIVPLLLVVFWAWFSTRGFVRPLFLPSPANLLSAFMAMLPTLPRALASSVFMTIAGLLAGVAFGVSSGLAMAYSKVMRDLFGIIFDVCRPIPIFALIPLFLLWFGIGRGPQIALIMVGTSLVVGLTTVEAVKNVPRIYIRAALIFGATRWMIYRTLILPAITPHLLGAIRAAAAASWGLDVAAEFIGAQTGLGQIIIVRQEYLDSAGIIVVVVIYSLLAVITDWIIQRLQRPFTRWTDRGVRTGTVASITGSA
jgi:ABC-type nitrate/sulfonate/bicarbonate transport system permease component